MIDTAAKRRSASAAGFLSICPSPDSTIDQGDRQQAAWVYRAILSGAFVAPPLITYVMPVSEVSQPVMEIL